jgi:hypothetical protein
MDAAVDYITTTPQDESVDEPPLFGAPADLSDERLIREGEAAAERFAKSRDQILPMARGLAAAKRKFPSTQAFGAWLKASPYSRIGGSDRAALISIGEQLDEREEFVVEFLKGTDLISPQTIFAAIKEKLQPALSVPATYYDSESDDELADADLPKEPDADAPDEPEAGDAKQRATSVAAGKKATRPQAAPRHHDLWGTDERFDLVVLTPSESDLKLLRADYADPERLKKCLPLHEQLEKEAAAVIIITRLRELPVMAKVLPFWGFSRPPRILLARGPKSPDVTDAEVLIAAERGDIEFNAPEDWPDDADPIEIAQRFYRDASSRPLHLFATPEAAKAEANKSRRVIIGDDSWLELPSVR